MRPAALELNFDVAAHGRRWHLKVFHWKTRLGECPRGRRAADGTDQTGQQGSPDSRDGQARCCCRCATQLLNELHSSYPIPTFVCRKKRSNPFSGSEAQGERVIPLSRPDFEVAVS